MSVKHLSTPALVLRRYPLGEADRLVVLFTPEHGLVRANAKGQRRSKKRFGGIIDLLYLLDVDLSRRRSEIWTLENARLADPYRPLSRDVMVFAAGCHLAEVAASFATEHHTDRAAFQALIAGLDAVCRGRDPGPVSRYVELATLQAAGLAPRLDRCGITGAVLKDDQSAAFESRHGGVVVSAKAHRDAPRCNAKTRRLLQDARNAAFDDAIALPWDKPSLRQARLALEAMITYHAGRALRARRFAENVTRFSRKHRSGKRV